MPFCVGLFFIPFSPHSHKRNDDIMARYKKEMMEDMPPVSHWAVKNTFCMLLHRKILRQNAVVFRHDFCTKLYYSGISRKKAVEIMGHASHQMIEKVYAALDEKQEKSSEKIDAMFKNIM